MNENQNIEWKESWRDEYLKWICGFANATGGKIYIGMNDSGKVVGVADADKLLEDIPNKVRDVLGIIVDVNLLEENGLKYVEIDVPPYSNPINYKGQYHYRSGSTKQELKGAALNRFILQRTGRHWDEFPVEWAGIEELSTSALDRFRKEAARSGRVDENVLKDTAENLLHDLRLIDAQTKCPTRAALLLFHPDPERFVTGIAGKCDFSIVTVSKKGLSGAVGTLRAILEVFENNSIPVAHTPSGIDCISLAMPTEALTPNQYSLLDELRSEIRPDSIQINDHIAVIAVVGRKMAFRVGTSGKIFAALGKAGINIRMISQGPDEQAIILGVDNKDYADAIRVLYNAFVK